jgi:hypothetical protein
MRRYQSKIREVTAMNKRSQKESKDLLWGLFWVGMVVVPIVYTVLKEERGTLPSSGRGDQSEKTMAI